MNKKEVLIDAIAKLKGERVIKTQREIAVKMGMNENTVSQAIKGNSKYLTDSFLTKFFHAFDTKNYIVEDSDTELLLDSAKKNEVEFRSLPIEEKLNALFVQNNKYAQKLDLISEKINNLLLNQEMKVEK